MQPFAIIGTLTHEVLYYLSETMIKYLFSFMMVLLVGQCEKDVLPDMLIQDAAFGNAFVLEEGGQQVVSGPAAAPLTLQLHSLTDSRCPEDVVCVWLGNANVVLKASNSWEKNKQLELCIGDCRPDPVRNKHTVRATIGRQVYDITLLEVLPYPNTTSEETANKVKLLVEPVN